MKPAGEGNTILNTDQEGVKLIPQTVDATNWLRGSSRLRVCRPVCAASFWLARSWTVNDSLGSRQVRDSRSPKWRRLSYCGILKLAEVWQRRQSLNAKSPPKERLPS